ncbi:MAG: hypothetical protein HRF43_18665 [Phycisphaerae bacterium]
MLLRLWLLGDMLGTPSGVAFVVFDLGLYGLIWAAGFTAIAFLTSTGAADAGGFRLPLLCGLAAFLLHNTIDFSLLVPATLTVLSALAALAVARTGEPERRPGDKETRSQGDEVEPAPPCGERAAGLAAMMIALLGLGGTWVLAYRPVTLACAALAEAREQAMPEAGDRYLEAAALDPLDPTPLLELAERFLDPASSPPRPEHVSVVLARVHEAIDRDPRQIGSYRLLGRLYELRYRLSGSESDVWAALGALRRAVEMYPQSPDEHLNLAGLLARSAAATNSPEWAQEARDEYATALALDAARPGLDEVRKWSPARRAEIEKARDAVIPPASQSAE